MGVYYGTTEITNVDWIPGDKDITQAFFGNAEVFTVWGEYDGTLPAQYSANGGYLAVYRIYGASGGVGDGTENLLNQNEAENGDGYLSNMVITTNGALQSASFFVTEYIKINQNTKYSYFQSIFDSSVALIQFFDLSKNLLSSIAQSPHRVATEYAPNLCTTFTSPQNAEYVRFNVQKSAQHNILVEGSTAPASYVPYGYEVDISITGNIYNPAATDPNNGYMSNHYMQETGEPVVNNAWHITEYIPIESAKKYVVNYAMQGYYTGAAFYDLQKNYLSGQNYMAQNPFTLTVPQNAAYARFSIINPTYYQTAFIKESEIISIYIGSDPLGEDEYISYSEQKVYRRTEQLHNPGTDVDGYTLNMGNGNLTADEEYVTSDYIAVAAGSIYTLSMDTTATSETASLILVNLFSSKSSSDFAGNLKSKLLKTPHGEYQLYPPRNGYLRFSTSKKEYNIMLNEGSTAETYAPYLQPTDPPVPLPALPTVDGTTIIDYAGQSAAVPARFVAKYRKEGF